MSSTRSGGRAAANAGGEKKPEEEHDDDEVYQYPRQGLGPVFASIESLLRCAICGGLSDPPVSLPCCQQTFCSLCIRQYLDSTTPRCPCCRAASASNQLLMCKELRSICAIWKRSRQAILAAAVVSSDAAASAGGAAAGAAAATTTAAAAATDSVPSGRRRVCAVGSGQGRDGGGSKMAKLYYHQLTEKVLKQKLLDVGLPVTGGKVAMIARHKRLALLDAASGDREVPVPRRELIRQVASWEREKDKEKQAVRSGAGGILSASASVSASASLGQSADGAGDGSVPAEAEKIVIPKKMQAGFAALVANARKNAKKRPSTSSGSEAGNGGGTAGGADNGSDSKRARVSPGLESGSSGGGGAGVCNGSGSARPHRSDSSSLGGGGRSVSGGAAVANGGGAGMRILGVAGRMVRTRGPWRCVFSNGRAPLPLAAAAAPPPSIRHAEEIQKVGTPIGVPTTSTEGGNCQGGSGRTMSSNGHVDASASSENGQGGGRAGASGGESGGGVDGGDSGGGGGGGENSSSTSHGEMDAMPAEAVREGGLVYLNTITGGAVHEPPAELLTRAEEADSAGEYLVFVPSRNFVEAAEAASGLSEAASAVGAAAENVLQAVADAGTCSSAMKASGSGGGGNGAEAPKHRGEEEQGAQERVPLPLIAAPTPPTAVKLTAAAAAAAAAGSSTPGGSIRSGGSSGGGAAGGGETWDRLSSLPMIDLSQGAPSAPLDVENTGGGGGGGAEAGVAVAVEGAAPAPAPAAVAAMWTCTACTLLNKARRTTCAVCSKARPKSFDAQQRAVQPASSSRSKLRLLQRRSGGGVPQSSITSFTSRPPSDANDGNGKSKAISGGASDDVQLVSPPSSAAPVSAAGAVPFSQAPPPPSQSSVTAPISGFPTVRSQDRSSPDVYAAVAPEKPQH